MSHQHKIEDCRTHNDFIQYAASRPNAVIQQKGKRVLIRNKDTRDCMQLNDDCVTLPKPARSVIMDWFRRLGLAAIAFLVGLGYLASKRPDIVAAVIKVVHG